MNCFSETSSSVNREFLKTTDTSTNRSLVLCMKVYIQHRCVLNLTSMMNTSDFFFTEVSDWQPLCSAPALPLCPKVPMGACQRIWSVTAMLRRITCLQLSGCPGSPSERSQGRTWSVLPCLSWIPKTATKCIAIQILRFLRQRRLQIESCYISRHNVENWTPIDVLKNKMRELVRGSAEILVSSW